MENQQIYFDLTCNHDVVIDILDDFALETLEVKFPHTFKDSGIGGESEIACNTSKHSPSLLTEFKSLFNVPFLPHAKDPATSPFLKTCAPDSLRELV
mmetsp:Transcript_16360/g.34659  ORF Transcript_16360/g.34659 Transcript_16360/m.34659 type:complete len:97 (+) Transcript_16360:37-327(+)